VREISVVLYKTKNVVAIKPSVHSWCSCYICSYLSRISIAGSRHFLRTDRFRRQRRCSWMPKPPRIEWRWVMKCVACRTAVLLLPNKTCLCPHQQSWSQAGPLFSFLSTLEWSWLQLALFTSDNVSSPSFESKLNKTNMSMFGIAVVVVVVI